MNCKPGDLAIHIRKGYLVNILRAGVVGEIIKCVGGNANWLVTNESGAHFWIVEYVGFPRKHTFKGGQYGIFAIGAVYDASLRPIRDSDGEDETLTWAGKPEKVSA